MLTLHQSGKGETIVLIHGFCENRTCFNKQVLLLKEQYHVVTMDLPGVGDSIETKPLSIEHCADELFQTLTFHGIRKCIMIGHSMGGYITLSFAKKYPQLLNGFGLLHSTAYDDSDDKKAKREQAIKVVQEKGNAFFIKAFVPVLFDTTFKDSLMIDELVTQALLTNDENIIAQIIAMKTRPSSIDFIKQTNLPVLFVIGEKDTVIPKTDMLQQAGMVKTGMVCLLQNAAHMGMIEEEVKCSEAILSFAEYCF